MKIRTAVLGVFIIFLAAEGQELPSPHFEQSVIFGDSVFHHGGPARIPKSPATLSHITYGFVPYWERNYNCPRWDLVERIAYFNCTISADGSITNTNYWYSAPVVDSALAYGVAVDLCIAQFDDSTISSLISSPSARANCIHNAIEAMLARGGSGINVDFEHPNSGYGDELVTFMAEFRESLDARGPGYWLSICLPSVDWRNTYFTDQLKNYCDAMFIMGYDYHWGSAPNTGPVDPLDDPTEYYDLAYSVEHYSTQSGAPEKIILGLPAYGYDWPCDGPYRGASTTGSGSAVFYIDAVEGAEYHGRLWDSDGSAPWYRYDSWHQCWYSDSASLVERYTYARAHDLMGVGWWALGYDDGDPAFWGAVEQVFCTDTIAGIVVDDGDPGFNCDFDNWNYGAYPDSGWKNDYLWCDAGDSIESWARWTPTIPETGAYDIYMWWMPASNRCDSVFLRVRGVFNDSFFISQKTGATGWHYIGRFLFPAGTGGYVGISDRSAVGGEAVIADAVRWVFVGAVDTIVDDLDPTFHHYGDTVWWRQVAGGYDGHFFWTNSTSHDYDVCFAEWYPILPRPGQYEVRAYIPATNSEADVKYIVFHAGDTDTVAVDQSAYADEWVSLGTYYFSGAPWERVYLGDGTGTAGENIAVDAIWWRTVPLEVAESPAAPKEIFVRAAPNPFNDACAIDLSAEVEFVEIADISGRVVFRRRSPGRRIIWRPQNLPAGMYIIRTLPPAEGAKKVIYVR